MPAPEPISAALAACGDQSACSALVGKFPLMKSIRPGWLNPDVVLGPFVPGTVKVGSVLGVRPTAWPPIVSDLLVQPL